MHAKVEKPGKPVSAEVHGTPFRFVDSNHLYVKVCFLREVVGIGKDESEMSVQMNKRMESVKQEYCEKQEIDRSTVRFQLQQWLV